MFDHIEELKRQFTDRYVVVDASQPELARFEGVTGLVKTVNMSGRALVEFQDYVANIAWYDIDLDYLKVVPKPEPGAAARGCEGSGSEAGCGETASGGGETSGRKGRCRAETGRRETGCGGETGRRKNERR